MITVLMLYCYLIMVGYCWIALVVIVYLKLVLYKNHAPNEIFKQFGQRQNESLHKHKFHNNVSRKNNIIAVWYACMHILYCTALPMCLHINMGKYIIILCTYKHQNM